MDRLSELGAEDGEEFLTIEDLNLLRRDPMALNGYVVANSAPPVSAALAMLPQVSGITVNTVHGNDRSIGEVTRRFGSEIVESMEGAAFMYVCLIHDVPFAQVRAVSNRVERRNRAGWKMQEAIHNLGTTAMQILNTLPAQP
jgi:futalosine hydrolase